MEILEEGQLEFYDFYCSICGTQFRARVDECDSVSYTVGIPFINVRCPLCKIHNCSQRADNYVREKDEDHGVESR